MELVFNIEGRIPSKKNSKQILINKKTNRPFIMSSKRYKEWHKYSSIQLKSQMTNIDYKFPVEDCISVRVNIFYPDMRSTDNTNKAESVHDLMVDCGVLKDDNWQVTGPTIQCPVYRKNQPGAKIQLFLSGRV